MTTPDLPTAPRSETNLLDLLSKPTQFFTALRAQRPSATRYLWLVALTGLVAGLLGYLMQRSVQAAMGTVPGMPMGDGMIAVFSVVGSLVTMLVMWLVLWGLGHLGAGSEGRMAEVAAATFMPSLLVSLIMLPLAALFPLQINIAPPNYSGLEGPELAKAIQAHQRLVGEAVSKQPLSIISNVLSYGAMAWEFYLIFIGLRVLTGDRSKALKGTLIPLLTLLVIGGGFWLMGRAAAGVN